MLDLGAGAGALTAPLVQAGARVVAVERNPRLASRLRRRFEHANVNVLEDDLLDVPLPMRPYHVVASIPFAIATPLLARLLDPPHSALQRAALVVEWGAAKRFSDPLTSTARIMWWRARFDIAIARRVASRSFNPPPAVDAAMLVLERHSPPLVPHGEQAPFLGLLAASFDRRRATAAEALAPIFSKRQLARLSSDLHIAPHEPITVLRVEQWAAINAAMVALVHPARWPRRKPSWSMARAARGG